jgi:hypothetical protein
MSCIHDLSETVSQLVASVKPIVSAWNQHNSTDSSEVRGSIDLISSCLNMCMPFLLAKQSIVSHFFLFD